jgi:hypothetical protein
MTNLGDSAWMLNTDLQPLTLEAVSKPLEKGKSKTLLLAFEKAAEQHDLNYFKDMLVDHQKAIQEDQEAQAEREAKKISKAKRKSLDAAQALEGDSMDIDEAVVDSKPKSRKRKKEIDSDGEEEKVRLHTSPVSSDDESNEDDSPRRHRRRARS